jgi:hypothetical protein
MATIRLKIIFDDNVVRTYGNLISREPLKVQVRLPNNLPFKDAVIAQITLFDVGQIRTYEVKPLKYDGNILDLDIVKELPPKSDRAHYRVDYRGYFRIKRIQGDPTDYYQNVKKINDAIKSSLSHRIRSVVAKEIPQIQYVLWYLFEMDNKIDQILELLRNEKDMYADYTSIKVVDVSGGGFSFFSEDKSFKVGELLFVDGIIDDGAYKIKFASISKIVSRHETKKGVICGTVFEEIDNEIREDLIKYVFDKDRDMLKEVRNL